MSNTPSQDAAEQRKGKQWWEKMLLRVLSCPGNSTILSEELSKPYQDRGITKVACFEALGFPLGAQVAHILKAGLVLVRKVKEDDELEGYETEKFGDFDGKKKTFKILAESISPSDKILIVDDGIEKGCQVEASLRILRRLGAEVIGASVIFHSGSRGQKHRVSTEVKNIHDTFESLLKNCQNQMPIQT